MSEIDEEQVRLVLACLNRNISDLLYKGTLKLMRQESHCDTCSHPEFLVVLEATPFSTTCEIGEGNTPLDALEDLIRNIVEVKNEQK